MARGEQTPQEKEAMKIVSARLNGLISANNIKQKELSEITGIPTSTLSGYVKGSSLPIAGNIQKLADYFGVKKSAIDPRFETSDSDFEPEIKVLWTDNILKFVHYETTYYMLEYLFEKMLKIIEE